MDILAEATEPGLEPPRAAHRAMVAGLAAGFHAASLFALKKINEFADRRFFNTESLLTGMSGHRIYAGEPG